MTAPDLKTAVLARVDFVDLVRGHTALKLAGSEWSGKCPFPGHPDSSPSFSVNPGKGLCHCHGCKRGGNAIDFQCLVDGGDPGSGSDFRAALEKLAARVGLSPADFSSNPERSARERDERERLRAVNEAALAFWQQALRDSARGQAARDYLARRGVLPATAADFGLGYAPPVLPGGEGWRRLLDQLLSAGHRIGELLALGLVKLKDGQTQADPSGRNCYDAFRGRIIFPVFDLQGRAIGFCGRALSDADKPKFLNTTTTPLYEKSKVLFNLNRLAPAGRGSADVPPRASAQRPVDAGPQSAVTGGASPSGPATPCAPRGSSSLTTGHRPLATLPPGLALVVEGNWEPLLLAQCGLPEACAPCGTGFTAEHAEALRRRGFKGVATAFDSDAAGQAATERLVKAALAGDYGAFQHFVVEWERGTHDAAGPGGARPDGPASTGRRELASGGASAGFKDPGELLLSPGGPEHFAAALADPVPAWRWLARKNFHHKEHEGHKAHEGKEHEQS